MVIWDLVKDTDPPEYFTNICGHDVTIYCERSVWYVVLDEGESLRLQSNSLESAKGEAEEMVDSE